MRLTIRPATVEDVPQILLFIKALADYEKLLPDVVATEEKLKETLFGSRPEAYVMIGELDGIPSGFALYYYSYSTFLGGANIYLEDLYVNQGSRGQGLGKALILELAAKAYDDGCGRLDWAVLNWNAPSIAFYDSLGAKAQDDWTGYRLDRAALKQLAEA